MSLVAVVLIVAALACLAAVVIVLGVGLVDDNGNPRPRHRRDNRP